jgi:hypothetical protein
MTHGLRQMAQKGAKYWSFAVKTALKSRPGNCRKNGTRRKAVMTRQTIRTMAATPRYSHLWKVVLCGVAGFALAAPAISTPAVAVDFYATVNAMREVPYGAPLPGLHLDATVKGQTTDIYIAPMNFIIRYDIRINKGEYLHVIGTQIQAGHAEVVLAREITSGLYDQRTGAFRPTLTVYLRNDAGPLWDDYIPTGL